MKISRTLSAAAFDITTEEKLSDWCRAVDKEIGGIRWVPVGGIENNVHPVEAASDPALALVERPTNSIDALLDLRARELAETAPSPHEAARRWWGVPPDGLSSMSEESRRKLADQIRVTMVESDVTDRPTVVIQDQGTGQHPDDFPNTLLSLLASNKKGSTHVMGVYNAGGAASYKFARGTVIVSRLAPTLLMGREDEVGITVVRYDPLDPDKFKSGVYVYMVSKDGSVPRLDISEMPDLPFGTQVRLIEYQLSRYARGASEPKSSLWHLFHAALPDPALPFRIIETRVDRFSGLKGSPARRVVTGLLHLLSRTGTTRYSDERQIQLGPAKGSVYLRYFVLSEESDPDAYTTTEQGLALTLNGQRQLTKDRQWLKRNLDLFFLFRRLIVLVDGTLLTNAAKRDVFASTRETGVDSPLTKEILDRVVQELREDDNLYSLEEEAKRRVLESATRSTTERVKRQLAGQIAAYVKGTLGGQKGGAKTKAKRRRRPAPGPVPQPDDSMMLDVPDRLIILSTPLEIEQGGTSSLRLDLNAKNGFLPKYADSLSIVIGQELRDYISVLSKGRLLGGRMRVTLECAPNAPQISSSLKVALVIQELGVLLTAEGQISVMPISNDEEDDKRRGGEPNIEINWVGREKWDSFEPSWDAETVGDCQVHRSGAGDKADITRVEWTLNEAFAAYERVIEEKKLGDIALRTFRENYEYPIAFALFRQRLAEEKKEREADDEGRQYEIPDDYVKGEKARLARAVLMAMEPEIHVAEAAGI